MIRDLNLRVVSKFWARVEPNQPVRLHPVNTLTFRFWSQVSGVDTVRSPMALEKRELIFEVPYYSRWKITVVTVGRA